MSNTAKPRKEFSQYRRRSPQGRSLTARASVVTTDATAHVFPDAVAAIPAMTMKRRSNDKQILPSYEGYSALLSAHVRRQFA